MSKEVNDGNLRKYLLGGLNDADQQALEERLMTETEIFNLVPAVEDELVDDYLEGQLTASEREQFERFFISTPERRRKVNFAMALRRYVAAEGAELPGAEPVRQLTPRAPEIVGHLRSPWNQVFSSTYFRLAASAVILLAVGLGSWRAYLYSRQPRVDNGIASLQEAYRDQRPTEARITELKYAPPPPITRGLARDKFDYVALDRAKALIQLEANEHPSAQSYHNLGRLYLAEHEFDKATDQFKKALGLDQQNAQVHADLGAALLEKAKQSRSDDDRGKSLKEFALALEQLSKAIDLDGSLLEALFNRALLYNYMGLLQQSAGDWRNYLEKDPDSKWSAEARRMLTELEEKKVARSKDEAELLPEFIDAFKSKNADKAYELMSKNTEAITGKLLWWQLLGAYLDLSVKGEQAPATDYLRALSYAGNLQEQKTGDRFISDLVQYYEPSTFDRLTALSKAHSLIDEGHTLLGRSQTDLATGLYTRARNIFEATGDGLEKGFADYWIGYGHYRKSEFKESMLAFSQLAEHSRKHGHLWLLSSALTMVANIQAESDQFSLSLACYRESLEISERIKDEYNIQKNLTSLAYNFKNLGDHDESLSYLQRGLERAGICWPGKRQMYRNFDTAAGIFNTFGYFAAAAEYEKAALEQALEAQDPVFEHRSYTHLGSIYSELQNDTEALRCAERSYKLSKTILDERADPRSIALSSLQLGHILRKTQAYDKAAQYYDDAIRLYEEINLFAFLYEAHKGRLLCYIAQGNDELATQELQIVLAFFEEHRAKIKEEQNRNSFFDLEQYVYDIAINFEHSRMHDSQKAFDYSETSRARSLLDLMRSKTKAVPAGPKVAVNSSPLMLGDIQANIHERVQILQYSVLNDKLLIWLISRTRFEVAEQRITAKALTDLVLDYWQAISNPSENSSDETRRKGIALYKILITPVESLLQKDQQVCVVPDKALNYLPFNALVSPEDGNYLVHDFVLSFAPSANTFLESSNAAIERSGVREERVLSVGDPTFNRKAFPGLSDLPAAAREAQEVAHCYKSSCCLVHDNATKQRIKSEISAADVIHIASHYVIDEQNPMFSKLVLTSSAGDQLSEGVLRSYEFSSKDLSVTRLVALSACQTGVERYYNGEGMIGMSRTFLAAGVPLVAASLWPVASSASADLMVRFHKHRRSTGGQSSAAALREAQLDLINDPTGSYAGPYYWASFIVIGGYASF